VRHAKEHQVKRVEDIEMSLRSLEQTRLYGETESRRRAERELQLSAEIEALRSAEAEQLKRIEEAEARLREQEQARQAARAKATQLADQEEQLEEELKSSQAEERSQFDRLQQLQTRVREEEEAIQVATAEARRDADQAEQRLAELEGVRQGLYTRRADDKEKMLAADIEQLQNARAEQLARIEEAEQARNSLQSQLHNAQEEQLAAEIESLRTAEAEQLAQIEEAEARLRAQEQARQSAQARMSQLAEQESALANDLESLRVAEEARLRRLEEMKSSKQDLVQRGTEPADSKAIVLVSEAAEWDHSSPVEESPADAPWLQIDLQHSETETANIAKPVSQPRPFNSTMRRIPAKLKLHTNCPAWHRCLMRRMKAAYLRRCSKSLTVMLPRSELRPSPT